MPRLLSNWFNSYMEYNQRTEACDAFHRWCGLFILSAVMERRVWFPWDKWIFPNQYIFLVGEPGCGKGTALAPCRRLIDAAELKTFGNKVTPEGFIAEIQAASQTPPKVPCEYDAEYMCAISAVLGELNVLMRPGGIYADLLRDITDIYDSQDRWLYKPKLAEPAFLHGVCVGILGCITPAALGELLPSQAIGGGLTSRCIMVYGDPVPYEGHDPRRTPEEVELFRKLIHDLKEMKKLSGPFQADESWTRAYHEWRLHMQAYPPPLSWKFDGYISRRRTHIIKLAMALSLARGDNMVLDADLLFQANAILEDTEALMGSAFKMHGKNPENAVMERIIVHVQKVKEISLYGLQREFASECDMLRIERMVMALGHNKYVNLVKKRNKVSGVEEIWVKRLPPEQEEETA